MPDTVCSFIHLKDVLSVHYVADTGPAQSSKQNRCSSYHMELVAQGRGARKQIITQITVQLHWR